MHFELSEEQVALQSMARELFAGLTPLERLRQGWPAPALSRDAWREIAGTGLTSIGLAETDGGAGGDEVDAVVVCEQAGYALVVEPVVEALGVLVPALRDHAGADVRARWQAAIAAGEATVGLALDDPPRLRLAEHTDAVVYASGADAHLAATTDLPWRARSPVDPARPLADLESHAPLPGTRLAAGALDDLRRRAAAATAAASVGVAQRLLDEAVAHASAREQFGVPIGSFQAVQHPLVDVLLRVESARVAAWYAALRLRDDAPDATHAVRVAVVAADGASALADRVALQVHGGIGFTWEHDLHWICKRAASLRAAHGGARAHRRLLAEEVVDAPAPGA